MMTSLPNISQAYRILVAEKKHKDIGKRSLISSDALGFVTERNLHHNKQSYSKDLTSRPKGSNSRGKNHSGNKKHNVFYFDHCHMTGHTIERCYKLHGYPSIHTKNNSHRKVVNVAQVQESEFLSNFNPSFTSEQHFYLMTLINKKKEQDDMKNSSSEEYTSLALLSGKFCFLSKNLVN